MDPEHIGGPALPEVGSPEQVEATQKSIAIIDYLKVNGPTSLTDIAEALGYSKSTIHRHLTTLDAHGYVTEVDGGYRLGLVFLDHGIHVQREHELYQAGKAKVDTLAEEVGEKVWLMAEENDYGVFIYHRQGRDVFRTYTRVGYRAHLHAFASGKAVLAFLPDDRIQRVIDRFGLPAYTNSTTTDRATILAELESIRDRGVAFNREESINGVNAVAAPVLEGTGTPIGSIAIAGPANRMSGRYLDEELPDLLLGVANEIEVRMAYR